MKSRYPRVKKKGFCRGCGDPVPKGRSTWCSNECWEPHTVIGRHKILRRDKVCQICGCDIFKADSNVDYQIDHVIPFSEGGKTTYENLRLLCVLCHKERTKLWRRTKRVISSAAQLSFFVFLITGCASPQLRTLRHDYLQAQAEYDAGWMHDDDGKLFDRVENAEFRLITNEP